MNKKIKILKKTNTLSLCLIASIFFILHSPAHFATEHDFKSCIDDVTTDEHECESSCDSIQYSTGNSVGGWSSDSSSNQGVDTSGRNSCYMNCQNRSVSEISVRCQPLLNLPDPSTQVVPDQPSAPIPTNIDNLITWPDADKNVPPSNPVPKTEQEKSGIDQRD